MSPLGHFTELIPHRVVAEVRVIAEAQRKTSGAIKRLAVFLDSATKALWQHLSNSESVLLEKLADERRQNSILATLFQEKNNECQDLKETLTLENARLSETLRQTLAEHPEAARLSAAVSAKDATILRLEQKLQAQEDRAATEGRQFTEKMKDMLQQQETMFRHTIEEIIGQTRRDAAGDLDKERIQGLLRQEQLRCRDLDRELKEAKAKISAMEEADHQHSTQMKSLEGMLASVRLNETQLSARDREAREELEELRTSHSTTVSGLEDKLVEADAQRARLQRDGRVYAEKVGSLLEHVMRWAQEFGHDDGVATELRRIEERPPETLGTDTAAQMARVEGLLEALYRFHRSQPR